MIRKILNKYNVNNLPELKKVFFSRMSKESTPDDYVKDVVDKKELSPRQREFREILEKSRLSDTLPYEWYDEETGVYQTSRSYGFVFE